ncbi:response regulator transcription factor [Nocardioides lijunqiniae]|uniref:response regulator transcription factor n=1 Tax=Nocardioides lijunqiniae TaxID=2760832 RepID=UPI001878A06D|nr:response regulator transcription factor [Nocardioides lijunqiniae]
MPPSPRPLRIAVLNDYDVVVRGLAAELGARPERVEVVELNGRVPRAGDVDVVLLDTFARVRPEVARLDELVHTDDLVVVVFAWSQDHRAVRAALDAGAAGYLSKSLSPEDLLDGLERVRAGETVVLVDTDEHAALAGREAWGRWPGRDVGLSPLEAEVLALIAQGLSNREIGATLFLSITSVKSCIRAAYRKTGITGRPHAITWALEHGFVPARSGR